MSIHWLTIFLAHFILITSDGLSVKIDGAENGQLINNNVNNINHPKGPDSLFEVSDSGISIKNRKIPTRWNHQKTHHQQKSYRRNNKERLFSEKDYQHLIADLSKVAKVQTSTAAKRKYAYLQNRVSVKNGELILSDTQLFPKLPSNGIFDTASNDERKRDLYCQAIQEVYVSVIDKHVPSYACKFGNKIFILASKRFSQDRRNSLYVNLDDDIIRKLNTSDTSTNNQSSIIPAILALKLGHKNYDVRNQ